LHKLAQQANICWNIPHPSRLAQQIWLQPCRTREECCQTFSAPLGKLVTVWEVGSTEFWEARLFLNMP
jgi:hypothetical protein